MGHDLRAAVQVVERIARDCPATAMVVTMHYAGTTLIELHGPEDIRREIAVGRHLTTLAWSESGSRSHFWAPVSTATADGDDHVLLNASKSMVTSAGEADSYVWSSQPVEAEGASTIWIVETKRDGLKSPNPFDGLGLRANASAPVSATDVRVPLAHRLAEDGGGQGVMFGDELPTFVNLIGSVSIGLMEGALERAVAHVTRTGFAAGGKPPTCRPCARAAGRARHALDGAAACARWRSSPSTTAATTCSCACCRSRRWPPRPRCWSPTPPCACAAGRRSARTSASSACSAIRGRRRSWPRPRT